MQKEAKFVLFENSNEGDLLLRLHHELMHELYKKFGNVITYMCDTISEERSDEEDNPSREECVMYIVALDNTMKEIQKLERIVCEYGGQIGQREVYFQHPNGESYVLTTTTKQ